LITGKQIFARKSFTLGVLLLLIVAVFLAGCNKSTPAASSNPSAANANTASNGGSGKTIVVANEDDVNTLDPAGGLGTHTERTLGNMYDTLIRLDNSGKIEPALALSWEASPDGLQYTFKLRENVKFQDGTAFNSEAVKFSFDRALDSKHPYYYGPYAFPNFFQPNIKSVDVVDPLTVKFTLSKIDPTFIPNLLWSNFGIVSPEAVKKYAKDFGLHGAGTGPYQIVEWDKGAKLVTKAYKEHWGGAPKIDNLIFKPVPEDAARLTQLQSGEIQVAAAISPQLIPVVQSQPNLKIEMTTGGIHTWFAMLNTEEGPLKNVKVRQALNYAINRDDLVKNLLKDTAVPSSSFSYPNTWAYNPASEIYKYDPEKAKQMLAEAGFPSGFTLRYIVPASGSGMVAPTQIANVMQSDLAKIGVKVEITTQDWNTYLASIQGGLSQKGATYDMAQFSWMSTTDDPGLYVNYFLQANSTKEKPNGFNDGYYNNPKVSELLAKAMETIDQNARTDLYKQAQALVAEDAPWIFMFHSKNVMAMAKNVEGVKPNPNMNSLLLGPAELK
jgi:peptide/nickel transport system substrate-binding protein